MSDSDQGQTQVYHRIETGQVLGTPDPVIEVYGDGSMGWYEWRIMRDGRIEHDTREAGYGNPDIALRDALIEVYGMPQQDELDALMQRGPETRSLAFQ